MLYEKGSASSLCDVAYESESQTTGCIGRKRTVQERASFDQTKRVIRYEYEGLVHDERDGFV
jgi:hypothetical protein